MILPMGNIRHGTFLIPLNLNANAENLRSCRKAWADIYAERVRAMIRSRKKYLTDMQSNLATAEDNGRKIGRAEEKVEIARNLLKINLPLDQIAFATGLTMEEVDHLRIDEGE